MRCARSSTDGGTSTGFGFDLAPGHPLALRRLAGGIERSRVSEGNEEETRERGFAEALAPAGFAAGIILVLIGLVIAGDTSSGWIVLAIGVGLALVFGFAWAYRATGGLREAPEPDLETAVPPDDEELEAPAAPKRYSRNAFLTGATVGVSGLIGVAVTVPIVGFAVAPAFVGQGERDVDLGPIDNFPQDQFVITTFDFREDEAPSVNRRTAYVRNNGFINEVPSFTILSNRCVHLGCPVQPAGPTGEASELETESGIVNLMGVQPANFSCPCHGGAYDTEGNRTAGPPTRALDRYNFLIRNGNLVLSGRFSVSEVVGEGAEAQMKAFKLYPPGTHVDGPDEWMTPWVS